MTLWSSLNQYPLRRQLLVIIIRHTNAAALSLSRVLVSCVVLAWFSRIFCIVLTLFLLALAWFSRCSHVWLFSNGTFKLKALRECIWFRSFMKFHKVYVVWTGHFFSRDFSPVLFVIDRDRYDYTVFLSVGISLFFPLKCVLRTVEESNPVLVVSSTELGSPFLCQFPDPTI